VATGWGNSEDEDAASFDSYEEDNQQQQQHDQRNLEQDATKRLKEMKFQTLTRL
jgi:hypothetical protein